MLLANRNFKLILVLTSAKFFWSVEKASAKSSTSKRMCSAREVTDDDIFQAGEHYNILLFPKVALNTNLSSVGGNATTDPLVVKGSCVGNLVGAEYITNIQGSKPFSGWCKDIFLIISLTL